jgi:hypothetical protein
MRYFTRTTRGHQTTHAQYSSVVEETSLCCSINSEGCKGIAVDSDMMVAIRYFGKRLCGETDMLVPDESH